MYSLKVPIIHLLFPNIFIHLSFISWVFWFRDLLNLSYDPFLIDNKSHWIKLYFPFQN